MWNELTGPVKRIGGAAGTVTLSNGGKVTHLWAHAASGGPGSVAMPDGMSGTSTIPIAASTVFQLDTMHLSLIVKAGASITFTGTDGFLIEWME